MTDLVLLNGLPGVGKSTVAAVWAARRPGTLCLDMDVVRTLVSGPAGETAGLARALGLAMAAEHLRGGRDVVVPQLVARTDQVRRLTDVAQDAGARLVHVVLEAPPEVVAERVRADAAAHRADLDPARTAAYAAGLASVARLPGVLRLAAVDVTDTVDALGRLLAEGP